eukprot:12364192-Alexandrium_andersonii.AAC.1
MRRGSKSPVYKIEAHVCSLKQLEEASSSFSRSVFRRSAFHRPPQTRPKSASGATAPEALLGGREGD